MRMALNWPPAGGGEPAAFSLVLSCHPAPFIPSIDCGGGLLLSISQSVRARGTVTSSYCNTSLVIYTNYIIAEVTIFRYTHHSISLGLTTMCL